MKKRIEWNEEKNIILLNERKISFEDIIIAINEGKLLEDIPHPNQTKYPNQKIFIVLVANYIYLVPYVEDEEKIFLKTIIPTRKLTKKYIPNNE